MQNSEFSASKWKDPVLDLDNQMGLQDGDCLMEEEDGLDFVDLSEEAFDDLVSDSEDGFDPILDDLKEVCISSFIILCVDSWPLQDDFRRHEGHRTQEHFENSETKHKPHKPETPFMDDFYKNVCDSPAELMFEDEEPGTQVLPSYLCGPSYRHSDYTSPQVACSQSPSPSRIPLTLRHESSLPSLMVHRMSSNSPSNFSPCSPVTPSQSDDLPSCFHELFVDESPYGTSDERHTSFGTAFVGFAACGAEMDHNFVGAASTGMDQATATLPTPKCLRPEDVLDGECSDVELIDF